MKLKLNKECGDTILDILHKLHVASMDDDDGGQDDADDDEDESESDEEQGVGEGEDGSGTDESGEDSTDDSSEEGDDGDGQDAQNSQGHGDFEYDGSFGVMANQLSDLTVNDSLISADRGTTDGQSSKNESMKKAKKNAASEAPNSEQSRMTDKKSPSSGIVKKALRSTVTREELLATMVREDRKLAREERGEPEGLSSAVVAAAAVGATSVKGNYRRPDPPSGRGNDKVRLEVCAENKKTGAPDLNGKKVMMSVLYLQRFLERK